MILGTTTVKSAAMFVGMISNVEFLLVLYGNDAFGGPSLRCGQPQCFFFNGFVGIEPQQPQDVEYLVFEGLIMLGRTHTNPQN